MAWHGVAAALAAWAAMGCGGTTVWYGHTPDRARRVEVEERGSYQSVRIGDDEHRAYDGIALESLVFSRDGRHVAYAARGKRGWTVVIDAQEGAWHDAIGDVAMDPSGRSVAYAAFDDGSWRVLSDRAPGPAFDAIYEGTLQFTATAAVTYVGERKGRAYAVVDAAGASAREGPAFDGIRRLTVGPRGHLAYVGRQAEGSRVVVDGEPQPLYEGIGEVVLGEERYAYAARRSDGWVAVTSGVEGPVYTRVDDLRISAQDQLAYVATAADGEHLVVAGGEVVGRYPDVARDSLRYGPSGRLAWVVQQADGQRMVLDGEPGPLLDAVSPAVFAPVGERWGYIARKGALTSVVLEGKPEGKFAWAADLVFSPDGRRYAYAAHAGERDFLAHDQGGRAVPRIIVGTIAFDPSSRHVGCVIGDPRRRRFHFTVDGLRHKPFEMGELVARAAADPEAFRGDPEIMRRWVAAELALLAEGQSR